MNNIKLKTVFALMTIPFCLAGCNNNGNNNLSSEPTKKEVTLPDAFKGTNFAYAGYDPGVALLFDNNNNPEIQNVSREVEFYDVQFEMKPLTKKEDSKGAMYFLHFKVTNQVIDDGYLKNNADYKFWLSYIDQTYFCGLSLDDESLQEPTITLMEGTL